MHVNCSNHQKERAKNLQIDGRFRHRHSLRRSHWGLLCIFFSSVVFFSFLFFSVVLCKLDYRFGLKQLHSFVGPVVLAALDLPLWFFSSSVPQFSSCPAFEFSSSRVQVSTHLCPYPPLSSWPQPLVKQRQRQVFQVFRRRGHMKSFKWKQKQRTGR